MRSTGGLHAQISDRSNLAAAVWLAAKGRRHQRVVQEFLGNLDGELEDLQRQLGSARLRCGECHTFTIHDRSERMEPALLPVPPPRAVDKTATPCRRLVATEDRSVPGQDGRQGELALLFFPTPPSHGP
ncbi:MAG: hypothetical protein NTW21_19115 [Verrucomicrobia bacterium]|nr:hypothetical protein [Verrucomicrobiota bacterium]